VIVLGVSTYCFQNTPLLKVLSWCRREGFRALEYGLEDLPEADVEKDRILAALLDANAAGMRFSLHAPLVNLASLNDKERRSAIAELSRAVVWAAKANCEIVVIHPGERKPQESDQTREKGVQRLREYLREHCRNFKKHNILIAVENTGYRPEHLIHEFSELMEVVEECPIDCVGITLDIAHARVAGGTVSAWKCLRRRVRHIHISDNCGSADDHHWPCGKGDIDFEGMTRDLKKAKCMAIIEITDRGSACRDVLETRAFINEVVRTNE